MNVDFILAGRGLAGSVLALQLLRAGYSVVSIDDPSISNCSRVSAGMINPLGFRKISHSWRALEALEIAQNFYQQLEEFSGRRFFHQTGMGRIFGTEHEAIHWNSFALQDEFSADLGLAGSFEPGPHVNAPFGAAMIKTAASVDMLAFLAAAQEVLAPNTQLVQDKFVADEVEFSHNGVIYREFTARGLVLCEGWRNTENKWFADLPLRPAKGEILTVKAEGLPDIPFSGGVFVLPAGNNVYKIGSTYEWGQKDEIPTPHQRADLEKRLAHLIRIPFEVVSQEAGIRPTVSDRRPLVGRHPRIPQLYIFNGLGTRGTMLAPMLASQMVEFMGNNTPVSSECSIGRFKQHHETVG
ncbi:MAG: FAD-binding oxidoreductase [Bacteroidia bacterium]|nr:FAD-binding oxidoreductase [Bacteroidia bacterium]